MPINTKNAERRSLRFERLADILAEAERLAALPPEAIRNTGNWSPPRVFWHLAFFIDHAVTGFPFRMPPHLRVAGWLLKGWVLRTVPPPGIKLPRAAASFAIPPESVTMHEGLGYLRDSIAAASRPGAMSKPSPLLGRLTHEQWEQFNCRHAELHLSFLHPLPPGDAHADQHQAS